MAAMGLAMEQNHSTHKWVAEMMPSFQRHTARLKTGYGLPSTQALELWHYRIQKLYMMDPSHFCCPHKSELPELVRVG